MKKIDKRVWYALPIIAGIYLIYRQFAKSATPIASIEPTQDNGSANTSNTQSGQTYTSNYPLKNGSRDAGSPNKPVGLVVELQKLINAYGGYRPKNGFYVSLPIKLSQDGIFGPNTEWAVEQYLGKKTIDSSSDLVDLEQKMIEKQQQNYFRIPTWDINF